MTKDEAYVREARKRSSEQKAEDAAVGVLRELKQRGRNPTERWCTADRRTADGQRPMRCAGSIRA